MCDVYLSNDSNALTSSQFAISLTDKSEYEYRYQLQIKFTLLSTCQHIDATQDVSTIHQYCYSCERTPCLITIGQLI